MIYIPTDDIDIFMKLDYQITFNYSVVCILGIEMSHNSRFLFLYLVYLNPNNANLFEVPTYING